MTASLPTGLVLRPLTLDDLPAAGALIGGAFLDPHPEADLEVDRTTFEPERSLAVFDRRGPVATSGMYSLTLAVPGTTTDVAGVSWVSVGGTWRRRGLLRTMLDGLHEQLHAGGEPVAALWASEAPIYSRFGYGLAARSLAVSLARGEASFRRAPTAAGGLREAVPGEVRAELATAYDAVWRQRPGHLDRHLPRGRGSRWDAVLHDPEQRRDGHTTMRAVLHETAAGVDGYALFAGKGSWEHWVPAGAVRVREVVAATPAAHATLWRYLLDLDLVATVTGTVALDDPLLTLLADPRRAHARRLDSLWVRLVDVVRALPTRRYAAPVDVVLELTDASCPWNARRVRLAADRTGATCAPTTGRADLRLDVEDLGAAYLGGTRLEALALAGRVEELTAGSLAALDLALLADREPHCPEVF